MKNQALLSNARIYRLRAQGYYTHSKTELAALAFGHRFAYRLCLSLFIIGLVFSSIPILSAMAVVAFLAVVLPKHPFDYLYNNVLRSWLKKPGVPNRSIQGKFACGIATVFIVSTIILFYTGSLVAAYVVGGVLIASAALVSTIDLCIPSLVYNWLNKIDVNQVKQTPRKVDEQKLEYKVKKMYREVALHPEVTYHFEMGRELTERLGYPKRMLDQIPAESIDSFAGVGYYFDLAALKKGDCVVDLGSGSGMDVFYAALEVGEEGEVIGLDMTREQLDKSIQLRNNLSWDHVIFHKSYIESLPIVSNSVDAVISNGVVNLSNSKEQVFMEAARILKSGGRLAISDIVTGVTLPENISCSASLWAACIGGAMQKDEYMALIEKAGLKVKEVKTNPYSFISKSAIGASRDYGIESISILAIKK